MGGSYYSVTDRSTRSVAQGYQTKHKDDLFEQNKKREIHESMDPKKIRLRESRDSENHPNSVPVIVGMDETGSMDIVPEYLVREGLPKIMSGIIERGVPDPQILFLGIGDSKCDHAPFQVGQFESGDAELDMWLTRVWLEGSGGGNGGESYHWAWYFAAMHTVTDAWEKRKQKGFLFTIGDERCLSELSAREISEVMGYTPERSFRTEDLLAMAQEKYNVYHLHIMQGAQGHYTLSYWKKLLGENCIVIDNYTGVSKAISDVVIKASRYAPEMLQELTDTEMEEVTPEVVTDKPPKIML